MLVSRRATATLFPKPQHLNAQESFDFTGRRILITGSNGGIGYSLALGLAEHGATAILNGRNAEKLHAAAELLREQGLSGIGIPNGKTPARHIGQLCFHSR